MTNRPGRASDKRDRRDKSDKRYKRYKRDKGTAEGADREGVVEHTNKLSFKAKTV